MVLQKAKSVAQLKKEIAEQEKRIAKEELSSKRTAEVIELQSKLFRLKRRKLIGVGAKAKRLSAKFGKGVLATGKKVAPVIKKQAKLIRDQQLRDDAIARVRAKKSKISPKRIKKRRKQTTSSNNLDVFSSLDF